MAHCALKYVNEEGGGEERGGRCNPSECGHNKHDGERNKHDGDHSIMCVLTNSWLDIKT